MVSGNAVVVKKLQELVLNSQKEKYNDIID